MSKFKILFHMNIQCSCISIKLDYQIAIKKATSSRSHSCTHSNRHTNQIEFYEPFFSCIEMCPCPCRANKTHTQITTDWQAKNHYSPQKPMAKFGSMQTFVWCTRELIIRMTQWCEYCSLCLRPCGRLLATLLYLSSVCFWVCMRVLTQQQNRLTKMSTKPNQSEFLIDLKWIHNTYDSAIVVVFFFSYTSVFGVNVVLAIKNVAKRTSFNDELFLDSI